MNPLEREAQQKDCDHDYEEVSATNDMEGETYVCRKCNDRQRLYYDDMR